jgi:hypothetical protein
LQQQIIFAGLERFLFRGKGLRHLVESSFWFILPCMKGLLLQADVSTEPAFPLEKWLVFP